MIFIAALALAAAVFSFARAISGYRSGRADLSGNYGPILEADRDDDPVGFSTAVWGNALAGLIALGVAG